MKKWWILAAGLLIAGILFLNNLTAGQGPSQQPRTYTEGPQAWALACAAVLAEYNGHRHDLLEEQITDENGLAETKKLLDEWWGITSRKELLASLRSMEIRGHRAGFQKILNVVKSLPPEQINDYMARNCLTSESLRDFRVVLKYKDQVPEAGILAWDLSRLIMLCREGYALGWLTEEEAWTRIMAYARALQANYHSWEELGRNYLIGREYWSATQTRKSGERMRDAYRRLIEAPGSPWNRLPWDMKLSTDIELPPDPSQNYF